MRPWVVKLFIQILPKVLFIERPKKGDSIDEDDDDDDEKHGEIMSGVFDVPSEIDKYLGYNRGYSFDYDVPPPLPSSRYSGTRTSGVSGGAGVSACAGAVTGSNDTVVNMASDEDEDAIELDAEDEYDDMFSPTTTTDDGLASPTFESHHHHHQHQHGCPVEQQPRHDPAMQTIQDAKFIAQHVKNQDKFDEVSDLLQLRNIDDSGQKTIWPRTKEVTGGKNGERIAFLADGVTFG